LIQKIYSFNVVYLLKIISLKNNNRVND